MGEERAGDGDRMMPGPEFETMRAMVGDAPWKMIWRTWTGTNEQRNRKKGEISIQPPLCTCIATLLSLSFFPNLGDCDAYCKHRVETQKCFKLRI